MATKALKKTYADKTPADLYKAVFKMFDVTGYNLFKKRDIANLAIANGTVEGQKTDLTVTVPYANPACVLLNLSAEGLTEEQLTEEGRRLFRALSECF